MEECLDSLTAQVEPFDEVVLVDDANADPAVATLATRYTNSNEGWRLVRAERPLGIVSVTNLGADTCTSDYLALVDCDDIVAADAVRELKTLLVGERPDLVATRYANFATDGQAATPVALPDLVAAYGDESRLLLEHLYLSHLKVVRAEFWRKIGGYRDGTDGTQDWHLAMDAHLGGTTRVLDRVLYSHRVHAGQTTHTAKSKHFRSVNTRRHDHLRRHVALPDAIISELEGVAAMLSRSALGQHPSYVIFRDASGLNALPASTSWIDVVGNRPGLVWMMLLGNEWVDLGATATFSRVDSDVFVGMFLSAQSPNSMNMAQWYCGYLDF